MEKYVSQDYVCQDDVRVGPMAFCMKMVFSNFLFVLFSVPVITVPSAKIALTKVIADLHRKKDCAVWQTFWKEFRSNFFCKMFAGMVLLLPLVAGVCYGIILGNSVWAKSIFLVWYSLTFLVECYWCVAQSVVDLPVFTNLKNALLMVAVYWKRSFALLFVVGSMNVAAFLTIPYSLLILPLFFFAFIQWLTVRITFQAIQSSIILDKDLTGGNISCP